MLKKLEISGLRGFATKQQLLFAQPTGVHGSGLTIVVGANNSGKSTTIDALRALTYQRDHTFSQEQRNFEAGDHIEIIVTDSVDKVAKLASLRQGSPLASYEDVNNILRNTIVVPSRRGFNHYFTQGETLRNNYMQTAIGVSSNRTNSINHFGSRLIVAEQKRTAFNAVLAKVLYPVPEWSIEVSGRGDYYIRFRTKNSSHSSEGLGEGIISLFVIIDALYDSNPNDTIVVDEPELSLHPSLQRKLAMLFAEYASDRQIVLSTHSPYFINLEALENGATIVRAHLNCGQSHLSQLSGSAAKGITGPLEDVNNPHTWGLNAREVFFLEDYVVLVEGLEDVIFYERVVQDQLGVHLQGNFFGWGVGGADKMSKIVLVLKDLGFSKVVGILDNDKINVQQQLSREFPEYHFFAIPAKDVRTKSDRKPPVDGLLDDANKVVRPEYFEQTKQLFMAANEYLTRNV